MNKNWKAKIVRHPERGFGWVYNNDLIGSCIVFKYRNFDTKISEEELCVLGEYNNRNPIVRKLVFDTTCNPNFDRIYCEILEGDRIDLTRGVFLSVVDLRGVKNLMEVKRVCWEDGDIKVRYKNEEYKYYKWNQKDDEWCVK